MITFDTETCGFHGLIVLIQYAEDDGEINLHDVWKEPVGKTLDLLQYIADQEVIGFNLAFDWFHIQKLFSTLLILKEHYGSDALPEDYIEEMADFEEQSRFLDVCIKPKSAMDIFLHARKGPYQSLMARKDIIIKKVPRELAPALAAELEKRIELDGIYFSKRSDPHAPKWQVFEADEPRFKNVILKFNASGALKVLAQHALKAENILTFGVIEPTIYPYEVGWAPFAKAISSKEKNWRVKLKGKKAYRFAWPKIIQSHINHWRYYEPARKYGADDVIYTRDLWKYFGKPEMGDDDSILACMVGSVRWHGFRVDIDEIKKERDKVSILKGNAPIDPTRAKAYISEVMDEIESSEFTSTKKIVLEAIAKMKCDCEEDDTEINNLNQLGIDFGNQIVTGNCIRCDGAGKHPAAVRANEVLAARRAKKEEEVLQKVIQAGRFHASFKVIGTLSSRMAGSDGLNAQGINNKPEVRDCFKLADPEMVLCGGDFDAFEVVIMDAVYPDKNLHHHLITKKPCQKCDQIGTIQICEKCDAISQNQICKKCQVPTINETCDDCNGTLEAAYKIHGLFAMEMFPHLTYADVIKSKGQPKDYYTLGKNGVFTMAYGGDEHTLINKYGVAEEVAIQAYARWNRKYPDQARERERIFNQFASMKQPGGIGSQVVWHEPADYIESLFGFRRYFTLENKICKALYDLAQDIPKSWRKLNIKVVRREREQKVAGAVSSALYGAAFSIQSGAMRAAANHVIQSAGATITKKVQRNIWELQPSGVAPWIVTPMNVHDEIACPTHPKYVDAVNDIVNQTVESFRPQVPLIKMDWGSGASSWATMK